VRYPPFALRLRLFAPSFEPLPGELPVEDEWLNDDAGEGDSAVVA
jgi:hypothetical protein